MTSPFYPDPSQRILALSIARNHTCHVINAELLLELAQRWENQEIGWDKWRNHTTEVVVGDYVRMWITGCQLFSITADEE